MPPSVDKLSFLLGCPYYPVLDVPTYRLFPYHSHRHQEFQIVFSELLGNLKKLFGLKKDNLMFAIPGSSKKEAGQLRAQFSLHP